MHITKKKPGDEFFRVEKGGGRVQMYCYAVMPPQNNTTYFFGKCDRTRI